jgi:hypothetical protein
MREWQQLDERFIALYLDQLIAANLRFEILA